MDLLEDSLSSIRLSHNVLLALCVAILGFAISPSEAQRYQALLGDLVELREILTEYDRQEFERYRTEVIEQRTGFRRGVQQVAAKLGLVIQPGVEPLSLVLRASPEDLLRAPSGKERTISEVVETLRNPSPISGFKPDDLEGELEEWLAPVGGVGADLAGIRLGGMQGAGRPQIEAYFDIRVPKQAFLDHRERIESEISKLKISPRVVEQTSSVMISFDLRIHGENLKVEGASLAAWLASHTGERASAANALIPSGVLAGLDEVGGQGIDEAIGDVSQKKAKAEEEEKLSLFGAEIPGRTAVILAPLAAVFMLLYLIAQLSNVSAETEAAALTLRGYPWLGLFPDILSRTLTLLSMAVLPLGANLLLLLRLMPSKPDGFWIGAGLTLAVGGAGLVALGRTARLRAKPSQVTDSAGGRAAEAP